MRLILAIKDFDSAQTMIPLLEGLAWPAPDILLIHVLEAPGGALGKLVLTAGEGDYFAQYLNNQRFVGETMLENLAQQLRQLGYKVDAEVSEGSPASRILEASAAFDADLILLTLPPKHHWETWMGGARVARRLLLEASTSLLICRQIPEQHKVRRAVFASDHSPYADRCLEHLIHLKPAGIEQITVMTAFQSDLVSSLGSFVGQLGGDVGQWVRSKLHDENAEALGLLQAAGYACNSEVREAAVYEAIDSSIRDHQAGLLILGAQGHSFVERMSMGSVSLHETLYGRTPLLVLRT